MALAFPERPLAIGGSDPLMTLVFQIPDTIPAGSCFRGALSMTFPLVDFFRRGPDAGKTMTADQLREFIRRKTYAKPGLNFLVMSLDGDTFLLDDPRLMKGKNHG